MSPKGGLDYFLSPPLLMPRGVWRNAYLVHVAAAAAVGVCEDEEGHLLFVRDVGDDARHCCYV